MESGKNLKEGGRGMVETSSSGGETFSWLNSRAENHHRHEQKKISSYNAASWFRNAKRSHRFGRFGRSTNDEEDER